jgi:hypothetical protein
MSTNPRVCFSAALFALGTALLLAHSAVAGTTGGLSGTVVEAISAAPVPNARVTVVSPSQVATATTDAAGRFVMLSLAPDSYTLSVERQGYEAASVSGVTVQADQTQTLQVILRKALRTIGSVRARAAAELVKPGTTIDIYSVNPQQAQAAQALGGGGSLNTLYSALAAVPGLYIPPEQQGVKQSVFIRGGYYDQVGYEYDGVPVNRSFDNYPGSTGASLGQQELQVYTGGGSAGASATGLSGFINQVIRTGTFPRFINVNADVGGPTFYHKLSAEVGGATPSRNFSYYVGVGGYDQDYRYLDQTNGAGLLNQFPYATGPSNLTTNLTYYPSVYPNCVGAGGVADPFALPAGSPGAIPLPAGVANDPGCFSTISPVYASFSTIRDREGVVNLHFGIPHHRDGGKDDIQILYDTSGEQGQYYSSINDAGLATVLALNGSPPTYPDYNTLPAGTPFFAPAASAHVIPYLYPFTPHAVGQPLPTNYRGTRWDDAAIFKLQYQKNLGSQAYLRVFGYTFYSDTFRADPNRRAIGSGFGATNYDYEVNSHTRGVEAQFADQLNAHNQVTGTFNLVTATTDRYFNTQYFNTGSYGLTNLTDGNLCYAFIGGTSTSHEVFGAGDPAPCNDPLTQGTFSAPTPLICPSGSSSCPGPVPAPITGKALAAGATYRITYTGNQGFENKVQPIFTSASIQDQIRPNDKLFIEAGVRFEHDQFDLASTQGVGQDFWFAAARREFCYNPVTLAPVIVPVNVAAQANSPPFIGFKCPIDRSSGTAVQTLHPDGLSGHLLLSNRYNPTETDSFVEPRVGFTYTANPNTVIRGSAGRYVQGPQNYEIQYASKEENLAYYIFQGFWQYGFTTPRHDPLPQYSDNYDLSYERQFPGTDMSLKLTPYYRYAWNQLYGVSAAGLSSSLNTGTEATSGIEFAFSKGNFQKNGLSGIVSYTYLNSKEKWANFPGTGVNPVDVYNEYIQQFNALTKVGGAKVGVAPCYGPFTSSSGSSGTGYTPEPNCPPTSIRNPYYNMAPQPLFDRNGWYQTGLDVPYLSPHVFSAVLNYRHDKVAVTPSFTLNAGSWYGAPSDVIGIDPRTCGANSAKLSGSPISKTNPLQADYTTCVTAATPSGNLYIPNPETGHFDAFGEFTQPWQLNFNMGVSYDFTPKIRANLILSNLFNQCFGGSSTAWSRAYPANSYTCGYLANSFYISNFFNGVSPNDIGANGVRLNSYFAHSFIPSWADQTSFGYVMPFNAYLQFSIKL